MLTITNRSILPEVFQKLLDGAYITDPSIFYLPSPGKIKAQPGQKLKPENVCWDVTADIGPNDPDYLPVVFLTGYKITYSPGAAAVALARPYPQLRKPPRTWLQWRNGEPAGVPGIGVAYKSNATRDFTLRQNPDGSLRNFISPDFIAPSGKTYRQLTPDGPLDSK
jgi:hypothetical protein